MTDEEIQREREEAERLIREINATIDRINRVNQENAQLEYELEQSINNVKILIGNCGEMDKAVYEQMGFLSGKVGEADISTKHVFDAINELTTQYFTFKKISTASKNVTQFTDEYHTRFSYYNELRRISLGYVVGLDSHIISSDNARKKVEKSVIMRHEAKEKQRGRKKITIAVLVSIALCTIAIFTALFLLPINIAYEPVKIDFPFEVEDVESVEMYHYDGVPASAEKKVVVAENDIKTLYDKFKGLSLKDKTTEETAGADVTSFRFNLSDGTSYDLIYACYGVKNGELKSEAGGFKYFTSADIGSYWNNLNTELEAIPINESELP